MEQQPPCFGESWEASAAECAGGYDAGFIAPNGSHVRKKCEYYDSCKVRTLLRTSGNAQPVPIRTSSGGPVAQAQTPWSPWTPQVQPQQVQPQQYPTQPRPVQGQQYPAQTVQVPTVTPQMPPQFQQNTSLILARA